MRQAIVTQPFAAYGIGDRLGDVDAAWLAKMQSLGMVEVIEDEPEPVVEVVVEAEPVVVADPPPENPVEVIADGFA